MSTTEELRTSIHQYQTQLQQVNDALRLSNSDTERSSLQNLRSDLTELLQLTRETLQEHQTPNTDPFADEMSLFMAEISKDVDPSPASDKRLQNIKEELSAAIGRKCSAPHTHSWGGIAHHNAMICGLDDTTDYDEDDIELANVKVKVLFTNPTHREMLPCSYYLDGDCRFAADKCRFSHGELIAYGDLKDFKEPDFTLMRKLKYPVLVKQKDRIWYKGRIVTSNFTDKTCRVRLDQSKKDVDCDFEDVLPFREESGSISSSSSEASDEEDDYEAMHRSQLIEQSLFNPVADQALGEWERHTKGFGSRMMQKYGYVIGTGLGQNGEGIIVPISAQILPAGRSLDHCMELREAANGDQNLFSVERKLKQQQKKQEAQSARAYQRQTEKTDVFSFINENIFSTGSGGGGGGVKQAAAKIGVQPVPIGRHGQQNFKDHSHKNLNVAGLKISEEIRRVEKDIDGLKKSMNRHAAGTPVYTKLKMQLNEKMAELAALKKSETSVTNEQMFRKDKTKLSVF